VAEQHDVPVYLDGLGNVNALNTVNVKTRIDGQPSRIRDGAQPSMPSAKRVCSASARS
jgi:hypothetical protein